MRLWAHETILEEKNHKFGNKKMDWLYEIICLRISDRQTQKKNLNSEEMLDVAVIAYTCPVSYILQRICYYDLI